MGADGSQYPAVFGVSVRLRTVEKEKADAVLRKLYDLVGHNPTPEEFKTLIAIDKLDALLAEREATATKTEARIEGLSEAMKRLKSDEAFAKKTAEELDKMADVALCDKQGGELSVKGQELKDANRRNKELTTKVAQCGKGRGEEFVACWRGEDGKIEYVFETRLTKAGIVVTRKWPASRDAEMERFQAERELVGKTVSLTQFLESTAGMFKDSVQKACRYYVVISGQRSEMNSEMFTNYRRVQDHFYHLPNVN